MDRDIKVFCVLQLDDIMKCVKRHLNEAHDEHVKIVDYCINPASDTVAGFQGEHYKLNVNIKIHNDDKTLYFFIKSLPHDEEMARKMNEGGYFYRESNVYMKILSQFQNNGESQSFHPMHYLTTEKDIILEDLTMKDFYMTNVREVFDDPHCFTALTSLAKFHAQSLILEETKSTSISMYRIEKEFKDVVNESGYRLSDWYIAGIDAAMKVAIELSDLIKDSELIGFKSKWFQVFTDALELCQPSDQHRNVLSHRDLWANNLMFRYNITGNPIQCVFVDFQASRCMPPAADVMSLIYLNLDFHRRTYESNKYIRHYYETLSEELNRNNLNVENIIPWDTFQSSCSEYKKWALVQSCILFQLALLESKEKENICKDPNTYEQLLNVSRSEFVWQMACKDPVYKERFLSSIDELISLYILKET